MNDKILDIFLERDDLHVTGADALILRKFFEYLDRNSLWLRFYTAAPDPVFFVSDDTVRYTFTLSQIKAIWAGLKEGKAIEWEKLPFDYVGKSDAQ